VLLDLTRVDVVTAGDAVARAYMMSELNTMWPLENRSGGESDDSDNTFH